MEKATIIVLKIKVNIMVNSKMESSMEMAYFNLMSNRCMKVILIKDLDMEKAKWNMPQVMSMKGNGIMIRKMVMGSWIGSLKIKSIKVNGKMINNMVLELIIGSMGKFNTSW